MTSTTGTSVSSTAEHDSPQPRRQVAPGDEPGDHQRHRQLHELRGLKADRDRLAAIAARPAPSLPPRARRTTAPHSGQIERRRPVEEPPGRNLGEPRTSTRNRPRSRIACRTTRSVSSPPGAVERHESERGEHQHPEQQGHVQVQPFAEGDAGLHRVASAGNRRRSGISGSRLIASSLAAAPQRTTAPVHRRRPGYRRARRRSRRGRAVPPRSLPLPPFSTTTATAIRGSSTGANATKSPWSCNLLSSLSASYSSSCPRPNDLRGPGLARHPVGDAGVDTPRRAPRARARLRPSRRRLRSQLAPSSDSKSSRISLRLDRLGLRRSRRVHRPVDDPRTQSRAPGGDGGGGRRQLKRRCQHVALPDTGDDRLPRVPRLAPSVALPGARRHQPAALAPEP